MLNVFIMEQHLGAGKEMVAGIASRHQREDFPPHPDDPSNGKIGIIVAHLGRRFNGVFMENFGVVCRSKRI